MVNKKYWVKLLTAMQWAKWCLLQRSNNPKSRVWRLRVRQSLLNLESIWESR